MTNGNGSLREKLLEALDMRAVRDMASDPAFIRDIQRAVARFEEERGRFVTPEDLEDPEFMDAVDEVWSAYREREGPEDGEE